MSESVKISYSSQIRSLVLEELETNRMDQVTLVCEGGEHLQVSCLLLAAMSPYLASILKTVDREECVIVVPDVKIDCINEVIKSSLNPKISSSFLENKSVIRLNGLFWNLETVFQRNNFNDLEENLKILSSDHIKLEPKFESSEPSISDTLNHGKVKNMSSDKSNKRKRTEKSPKKGYKKPKKEPEIPDFDLAVDGYGDFVSDGESNLKFDDSPSEDEQLKADPDFDSKKGIKKEGKKTVRRRKRKTKIKEDPDSDVGTADIKKETKSDKVQKRPKKAVYSEEVLDEEFTKAQESLKKDILDSTNLEDPYLLVCKYHDLNPKLHYLRSQGKEVKLICPVCNLVLPTWKGLISHLREYKYKNFACSCVPEDTSYQHLQVKHWGWTTCDICSEVVFPAIMPNHRLFKHNDKEALHCPECNRYFEKRHSFYWDHMDKHIINKENCGCSDITFENKSQKSFHIQVFHLKQKIGCNKNKCYFMCNTQEELLEHVQNKHLKKQVVKEDVMKPALICDICGQTMQSKKQNAVEIHKARIHDTVKVQCPQCPLMFTPLSLKGHLRKVHSGGVCNICGVKVNQLQKHINEQHSVGKKMYKCEYCPKQFYYRDMFKKHLNTHLKQNVYPCRYGCEFPYTDSSNRNHHEKKKHGQLYSASVHNSVREDYDDLCDQVASNKTSKQLYTEVRCNSGKVVAS